MERINSKAPLPPRRRNSSRSCSGETDEALLLEEEDLFRMRALDCVEAAEGAV
jgi:hypothetical protein